MHAEVVTLIEAWHWMYFETDLAFGGLKEENLHRRPGPGLLAVSEHAAHVARGPTGPEGESGTWRFIEETP